MKRMFYVFIVIFIISCVSRTNKNVENDVLVEGIDFVVFTYKNDSWMQNLFKDCVPTKLSEDDLNNINIILNNAIENYNKNIKKNWEEDIILSNYKRQYIAVINNNGEKEVYINCFSLWFDDSWKTEHLFIADGGNSVFKVKINLTKKTYYNFSTNGYA